MSRVASVAARAGVGALLVSAGGCFATRNDLQLLQQDIAASRGQAARADSARAAQLAVVIGTLRALDQSIRSLGADLVRRDADVRGELRALAQQLIQVQELTGQSQKRLQELRAELEQQKQDASLAQRPPAGDSAAGVAAGPNQLFQTSYEQLQRGNSGTARAGFEDLLRRYPTSDLAPEAQYYVAETYAADGNAGLADSAYAIVVQKWPRSARAPEALYKRGLALQRAGRAREARGIFQRVVAEYPRSDAAQLARDALRVAR